MQAAETLKLIIGLPVASGVLKHYNALSGTWQQFAIRKNPQCPVCSRVPAA